MFTALHSPNSSELETLCFLFLSSPKQKKILNEEEREKRNTKEEEEGEGMLTKKETGQAVAQAAVYSRHGSDYNSIT